MLVTLCAEENRGKAELSVGAVKIVVDYGRPMLKGREMFAQLKPGDFWRLGMNQATTITTSVDLSFGNTKIAKRSYSLWLLKNPEAQSPDKLVDLTLRQGAGNRRRSGGEAAAC